MSPRLSCSWLALVLVVALVSRARLRAAGEGRCAFDGDRLGVASQVLLFEPDGATRRFCGAECALAWAAATPAAGPRRFQVHDEQDATPLDPAVAWFVRSLVPGESGRPVLRAFRDPVLAAEHARASGGALVENPFPTESR